MKRKRSNEEGLTPEELQRRKMQRELQALATKLRTEGQSYKPQKHKRKVYKAEQVAAGLKPKGRKKAGKDKKSKHDTPKWRPYEKTDVVILPIFWNMRHEEKNQIMAAAAKAAELLQEAGISSHTDISNKYTPGQKMKYWETAGVKVRVEIGPKEAASGSALVARAGLPGTVAQKTSVNVAVQLVREVKQALQEGKTAADGDTDQDDQEEQLVPEGQGSEELQEGEGEEQEDDLHGDGDGEDEAGAGDHIGAGMLEGSSEEEDGDEGQTAGVTSNRERKRLKKERKKAAQKLQARAESAVTNVQEGSRRDRKRKAKEAAGAAKGVAPAQAATLPAEQPAEEQQGEQEQGEQQNSQLLVKMSAKAARKAASQAMLANKTSRLEKQSAKREFQHLQQAGGDQQGLQQADDSGDEELHTSQQEGKLEGEQATLQHHAPQKQGKTGQQQVQKLETRNGSVAAGPILKEDRAADIGLQTGAAGKTAASRQAAHSNALVDGDDLGDDFEIDAEFLPEPEEDALVLSKQQRMKKHKKLDKQRRKKERYGEGAKAWDAAQDAEAPQRQDTQLVKKKPKTVVF